jgi:hypothetical protein
MVTLYENFGCGEHKAKYIRGILKQRMLDVLESTWTVS